MKWENTQQEAARHPVVRVLSFYRKTEDGAVTPVASKPEVDIRRTPSESGFTSLDLKKSRARTSSLLRKQLSAQQNSASTHDTPTPILPKKEDEDRRREENEQVNPSRNYIPPEAEVSLPKEQMAPASRPTAEAQAPARDHVVTSTPMKPNLQKSSSFSVRMKPSPIPTESNTQSLCRSKVRKDPERHINKLILRVPSAACEYENKRVIHSICVKEEGSEPGLSGPSSQPQQESADQKQRVSRRSVVKRDSGYSVSHLIEGGYFSFEQDPAKTLVDCDEEPVYRSSLSKSESTANLIPVTPRVKQRYRHLDFTKNGILHTISGEIGKNGLEPGSIDLQERWKTGPSLIGTSSEVGSTSLSNFSSGDGLSTPTHMGSTTRLIYNSKARKKWRCSWTEQATTCCSIAALAGNLGNVLRLPRMVFFHGGGIFLLVYILLTLVFGIPLIFLEIGLGQFCQHGTIKFWRAVNLFRGVGYVSVLLSFITGVYYSVYGATALSLLAWSAKGPVPFVECESMNTTQAYVSGEQCLRKTFLTPVADDPMWFGLDVVFLFLFWVLILACVLKKSQSYKHAMCVVFPLMVAIVIALLVDAASRSTAGLSQLVQFEWTRLSHVEIWYFCFVEMLFSLQIGFGTISTSAGRIYPKSNAFWSAAWVVVSNLILGVAVVCLVYLWIGQLDSSGVQLPSRFQVPELFVFGVLYNVVVHCVSTLKGLWAALGFLLFAASALLSLVMFSYSVLVAVAIESKRKWHWWQVASVICSLGFVFGVLSFLPSYLSLPHLLDHYTTSRTVVFVTCLQLIGFAYIYGCKNLYNDFEFVIGQKLTCYWRMAWTLIPVVLVVVEVVSANVLPLTGEFALPDHTWQFSCGWALYFVFWIIFITCACFQVYIQVDYNLPQKFLSSIKPSRNWGPVDPIYRHCWIQWRNRYHMTGQRDFTLKRRGTRDYTHSVRTATADSISNSFDMGGVNPATTEWTYKRSTASAPYTLDTRGDHICWRKDNPS